jgi:hypothetical protein
VINALWMVRSPGFEFPLNPLYGIESRVTG